MSEQKMRDTLDKLRSVLCDQEGKACIAGSAADLVVIDSALAELATLSQREAQEPAAWISEIQCVGPRYGEKCYARLPIQSLQAGYYKHTPLYTSAPSREVPEEWCHAVSDLMATIATHPSCQKGMVNRCVCRTCAMLRARDLLASKGGVE